MNEMIYDVTVVADVRNERSRRPKVEVRAGGSTSARRCVLTSCTDQAKLGWAVSRCDEMVPTMRCWPGLAAGGGFLLKHLDSQPDQAY